ncbi:MAG: hypothetical protein MHM6MM_000955 [Cercozoa sp. M6MM]
METPRSNSVDSIENVESELSSWNAQLESAEQLVPLLGRVYREHNSVATVFGRSLMNLSPLQILRYVSAVCVATTGVATMQDTAVHCVPYRVHHEAHTEVQVQHSFAVLQAFVKLRLGACRVDVGAIGLEWLKGDASLEQLLRRDATEVHEKRELVDSATGWQDVVLYGFGRIGRLLARLLIEKTGGGRKLRLRAIVLRPSGDAKADLEKRASLLARDSVHGEFPGVVATDAERHCIVANGSAVHVVYAARPGDADLGRFGIRDAILIDNTGKWRTREALSQHLKDPAVARVVLTAPGADIANIVVGVNEAQLRADDAVVAAASCTTNAVCPVLSLLDEHYGVESCHLETVHAYTNDQNLLDNNHKKNRRGRAAALNMVLTETGAAKAVGKALPQLAGRITGHAIRVPTPNVSLAIVNAQLRQSVGGGSDEINALLSRAAVIGPLMHQLGVSDSEEAVSSDFIGTRRASVVDLHSTHVDDKSVRLYCWYDNEFGYSAQVVRLLQRMGGVRHPPLPSSL